MLLAGMACTYDVEKSEFEVDSSAQSRRLSRLAHVHLLTRERGLAPVLINLNSWAWEQRVTFWPQQYTRKLFISATQMRDEDA